MKRTFFVDTSYLIALEASDDQHHRLALTHWRTLGETLPMLLTTSYVFDGVVTFFNCRGRHDKAVELGERLLNSPSLRLVQVSESLFREAWRELAKHSDKRYSLTDCISFLTMKRFRLHTALTSDDHFAQAGFEKLPKVSYPGLS